MHGSKLLLFSGGSSNRVPVRNGLVAEYKFDEGSGQTLIDYSGYGNNGTLGSAAGADDNDPTWSSSGLYFNTNDNVDIGNTAQLQLTQYTIIAVWLPDVADAAGTIIAKNSQSSTGVGRTGFFMNQTTVGAGCVYMYQFDSDGAGTLRAVTDNVVPSTTTWNYVAGACNGTNLYMSTSAANWTVGASALTGAAANTTQNAQIGRYAYNLSNESASSPGQGGGGAVAAGVGCGIDVEICH